MMFIGFTRPSADYEVDLHWHVGTKIPEFIVPKHVFTIQADGHELEHIRQITGGSSIFFNEENKNKRVVLWADWRADALYNLLLETEKESVLNQAIQEVVELIKEKKEQE